MILTIALPFIAAASLTSAPALAYTPDWKRGRIYYRAICSSCHSASPVGVIQPNSRTMAEWNAYFKADRHSKGTEPLRRYFSREYLSSIQAQNRAAQRFVNEPSENLFRDVELFLQRSAKDGAAPASCS